MYRIYKHSCSLDIPFVLCNPDVFASNPVANPYRLVQTFCSLISTYVCGANDCIQLDLFKIGLQVPSSCVYSSVGIVHYVTYPWGLFSSFWWMWSVTVSNARHAFHMFMSPVLVPGIARRLSELRRTGVSYLCPTGFIGLSMIAIRCASIFSFCRCASIFTSRLVIIRAQLGYTWMSEIDFHSWLVIESRVHSRKIDHGRIHSLV
jgi:hypothetical protein